MDMQNVSNLQIPEGIVRTIHDKDNRLIWGRVNYDTKYAGNTVQNETPTPDAPVAIQTVTGSQAVTVAEKNLFNPSLFDGITAGANGGYVTSKYYNASTEVTFSLKPDTSYILSLRDGNYNLSGSAWSVAINGSWKNISSGSLKITTDSSGQFTLKIGASSYSNISSNERFIQLEEGSAATEYRPYTGQTYTVDFGSIELCKIGDYQDYIYKSGGDWYVHKDIRKAIFSGAEGENWSLNRSGTANFYYEADIVGGRLSNTTTLASNYGVGGDIRISTTDEGIMTTSTGGKFRIRYAPEKPLADWKTELGTTNLVLYYPLATPTDTKITDATLISQLNAVHQWLTRYGYNATVSGNLPLIVNRTNL